MLRSLVGLGSVSAYLVDHAHVPVAVVWQGAEPATRVSASKVRVFRKGPNQMWWVRGPASITPEFLSSV